LLPQTELKAQLALAVTQVALQAQRGLRHQKLDGAIAQLTLFFIQQKTHA
jgi:hypothetical protein